MFEKYDSQKESDKKDQEPKKIDRREFLKSIGAATAGTTLFGLGINYLTSEDTQNQNTQRNSNSRMVKQNVEVQRTETGEKAVSAHQLEGYNVSGLFKAYLGLDDNISRSPVQIENEIHVNFGRQLETLWELKARDDHKGINQVAKQTGKRLVAEYQNADHHTAMSLSDYQAEASNTAEDLYQRINWKRLADEYGLNNEKAESLKQVAEIVRGNEMLAYAITELMPSQNGGFNAEVFNFLLENAGREYVESIPAIDDELTSFGPYQITSNALYAVGNERRGASRVDYHTENDKLSGSVADLRGADHHRSAYLFALHNLARLFQNIDRAQAKKLADNRHQKRSEITQYIAAAHNFPNDIKNKQGEIIARGAISSGQLWIANDMELPYWRSCDSKPLAYAQRSYENYNALKNRT